MCGRVIYKKKNSLLGIKKGIKHELNNLWSYYNCNVRPNNEITNE